MLDSNLGPNFKLSKDSYRAVLITVTKHTPLLEALNDHHYVFNILEELGGQWGAASGATKYRSDPMGMFG